MEVKQGFGRIDQWFVVFKPSSRPFWWMRFLEPNFQHCLAFGYDSECGVWIMVDPTLDGMCVRAIPEAVFSDLIIEINNEGGVILLADTAKEVVSRPRAVLSCVSVIMLLLGLNKFIFTPHQLYCALIKQGAERKFNLSTPETEIE